MTRVEEDYKRCLVVSLENLTFKIGISTYTRRVLKTVGGDDMRVVASIIRLPVKFYKRLPHHKKFT